MAEDQDQGIAENSDAHFEKGTMHSKTAPSKRDERTARMGTGSIPKLVLEFAIPSIVGMLVNGAYNVIDSVFLGQAMGEIGLSVATAAMPIMTIFMALSMLIGNGGNALAALRLGEGSREAAEKSLGNTVSLGIILAIIIAVLACVPPCMEALLSLSECHSRNPRLHLFVYPNRGVRCDFQIIGMGVNNFIRTAGAPNRALLTMIIGTVSCIILNYLFVLVLGWGVVGSAACHGARPGHFLPFGAVVLHCSPRMWRIEAVRANT